MTQQTFWNWFLNSALILWTRFQVLAGCILLVITMSDMSPWIPAKYLPIWIIISNVIAEYMRRSNTQENTIQVVDRKLGIMQDVTYLKAPDPVPVGSQLVQVKSIKSGYGSSFGLIGVSFALTAIVFMIIISVLK